MARIRTIKPDFFDDKKMSELSIEARFLYVAMWVFSDDECIILQSPHWIKSKVFPHNESLKLSKVKGWLKELEKINRIFPFDHAGECYYLVPKMKDHQRIDKPQASKLPKSVIDTIRGIFQERSKNVPVLIVKDSNSIVKEKDQDANADGCCLEYEAEKEKNSPPSPPQKVQLPFTSEVFSILWDKWKDYRKSEHNKKYKSESSEQAALHHLVNLSQGREDVASEIIMQSMGNSWQGLFELKQSNNGQSNSNNKTPITADATKSAYDFFNQRNNAPKQ